MDKSGSLGIIERYDRQFEYAGVLFQLVIAYKYFQLWSAPQPHQAEMILSMALLMIFEFVMVHSGVFMAILPKKWSLFVFVPVYGIFALAFNMAIPNNHIILITYLLVVINRMRFAFSDVPRALRIRTIVMSVAAALVYFVLIFVVLMASDLIPELGLTPSFLASSGYNDMQKGSGEFVDYPHLTLCFGALYYTLSALVEFKLMRTDFLKKFNTF